MFTTRLAALGAVALATGCWTAYYNQLTAAGSRVKVSPNSPAAMGYDPRTCDTLGVVVGTAPESATLSNEEIAQQMTIDLQNRAAGLGANYVQAAPSVAAAVGSSARAAEATGTAYRCDEPTPQPTAAPPTAAAGFTFGSTLESTVAACSAKYEWVQTSSDSFECSGTPRPIGFPARARLTFCSESLCKIVLVVHPDSQESREWVRQFNALKKTLLDKYGDAIEERTVPDECQGDVLPCIANGTAHLKYVWRFPDKTVVALVFTKGPDPVIRLTYSIADQPSSAL
jgi:hypothetical protein